MSPDGVQVSRDVPNVAFPLMIAWFQKGGGGHCPVD